MPITRELMKTLRTDVDAALLAISKKHGVLLSLGNGRFTASDATFKLNVTDAGASAIANVIVDGLSSKDAKAVADYQKQCHLYGLKPEWLNRQFMSGGKALTVVGLLPNKHKNNVLVMGAGGGKYIMPATSVAAGMK
jgi:hypothetical protein